MNPSDGRQRRFRITIRVTAAERQTIDAAAARSSITRSAYARYALLGAKPLRAARRPSVDATMLVCVLDRLGNIASAVRALSITLSVKSGFEGLPIERDLSRTLAELRSLRPQLLQALGKRPRFP
jgi:uncharacterized protein (DUF1778 family)